MGRYDPFVASPDWHHWIILYFFLGGIAAGAYALACLARLMGDEADRRAVRAGDYLATPLIAICGVFLVIDLGRPERFWHMLIQSNTFRPMFKWWSPMSAGSWGLSAFGAFAGASFLAAVVEDDWFGLGRFAKYANSLTRGVVGRLLAAGGLASACFLGSYTGSLLTASNQPIWAQTTWLSPLFLASAASTGAAALILAVRWRLRDTPHEVVERLERFDALAMVLELALLGAFAASLGDLAAPALLRWPGVLIPAFVLPIGLVVPLVARYLPGGKAWAWASPTLVLVAGLVLRYAVVEIPGRFAVGSGGLG